MNTPLCIYCDDRDAVIDCDTGTYCRQCYDGLAAIDVPRLTERLAAIDRTLSRTIDELAEALEPLEAAADHTLEAHSGLEGAIVATVEDTRRYIYAAEATRQGIVRAFRAMAFLPHQGRRS